MPIRGLRGDLPVRFAPDGGAVPGDRIVGIMTPGEGITIYPIQSPALTAFDDQPERWLDVRWDVAARRSSFRPDHRRGDQRAGQPRRAGDVIGEPGANIDNVELQRAISRTSAK